MSTAKPHQVLRWHRWLARGQGLAEYALILALMAIAIVLILTFLGGIVFQDLYSRISSSMPSP